MEKREIWAFGNGIVFYEQFFIEKEMSNNIPSTIQEALKKLKQRIEEWNNNVKPLDSPQAL